MIAGIDSEADISIYLENDELKNLSENKEVAGILVRTHKPESQGTIKVKVDDSKKCLNSCIGVGIEDKDYWGIENGFNIDVFIGDEFFDRLQQQNKNGTRQGMKNGSKIDIYNNPTTTDKLQADHLKFCRDNKEKYKELSERK